MDKNMRLGRGLSALMGDDEIMSENTPILHTSTDSIQNIATSLLVPSPFQPRRVFTTEALADLVMSIKEKGVLQPLLVRSNPKQQGSFEIIAGERRFRASKMAGLEKVPVIIKNFSDKDALEVALIENLQREDLNPLEEAQAYKKLLQEFHYTQEDLSRVVGKSRSHLANMMRLLDLPDEIKNMLENKEITVGHARVLLTAEDPIGLAHDILKKGYSVRQTEKISTKKNNKKDRIIEKDADIIALEKELSRVLNTKIHIQWNGKSGKLSIDCPSLEKLDLLLQRLSTGGELL